MGRWVCLPTSATWLDSGVSESSTCGIICSAWTSVNEFWKFFGMGIEWQRKPTNCPNSSELWAVFSGLSQRHKLSKPGGRRPAREGGSPCGRLRSDLGLLEQSVVQPCRRYCGQLHRDLRKVRTFCCCRGDRLLNRAADSNALPRRRSMALSNVSESRRKL